MTFPGSPRKSYVPHTSLLGFCLQNDENVHTKANKSHNNLPMFLLHNNLIPCTFFLVSDWIFKLGPLVNGQYQYSIVSDGGGLGLFVLCRDPPTFEELYEAEVLEYLSLTGFTETRAPIKEYQGPDCDYPPFEE